VTGAAQDVVAVVWCDNQSAIQWVRCEALKHARTKHIAVAYHKVRELHAQGDIDVRWIGTRDQEADMLTKRVETKQLHALRVRLLEEV